MLVSLVAVIWIVMLVVTPVIVVFVTDVQLLAPTAPVPVEIVMFATASDAATPVPRPDTPELMGRPVALVSVAADGVPRFGVVKTGEFVRARVVPLPDVP